MYGEKVDGPVGFWQGRRCNTPSLPPTGPILLYSSTSPDVSPLTVSALLLAAIPHLHRLALPHPTATAVLDELGVSRSRAYELKRRLEPILDELVGPPGRPSKPPPEPPPPQLAEELLRYVAEHPGSISGGSGRRRYSRGLHLHVLQMLERHRDVSLEAFSAATTIPLGTLKDWLRGGVDAVENPKRTMPPQIDPIGPQLQTLLAEWERWQGSFVDFCNHVQLHCRLPFGRTLIDTLLRGHGVRVRQRRQGRSPDELALRNAFITFFPHAQWVGDGTQVPIEIDGELFVFNLELDVDAFSGAFVGAAVSLVEDSAAVIATFVDAIETTGVRPLALLLDNKPSNHTEDVEAELGDTLLIRSTPYRPQNKAHIEGGFGLLKPNLEGLELYAGGDRAALAASYLKNLVITVCRAVNHRPRRDRGGRSRVDLLGDEPTPEQIEQARKDLAELKTKQDKARETRAARQNPVVRAEIEAAYQRLGLLDPKGHILLATARYPLDAVVEAIAIFEARRRTDSLPETADARYLLGIARNLHHEHELWALSEALWARRVAARDRIAEQLDQQLEAIAETASEPEDLLRAYIDRAMKTGSRLVRFFWLVASADVINDEDPAEHRPLFRLAARRISSTHHVRPEDRSAAVRFLAAKVRPLR